jgi:hypothetical protein
MTGRAFQDLDGLYTYEGIYPADATPTGAGRSPDPESRLSRPSCPHLAGGWTFGEEVVNVTNCTTLADQRGKEPERSARRVGAGVRRMFTPYRDGIVIRRTDDARRVRPW